MAGELVLITGISGFLGFRVLFSALEHGYRVRGVLRRDVQISQIRAVPALKPYLDQLEIVIVPDITKDGAFDAATRDVEYILHVASPLGSRATEDYYTSLIEPALQGTIGMLKSAAKSPRVKRVVITSSGIILNIFTEDGHAVKETEIKSAPDPHTNFPNASAAYAASKLIAYAASKEWMENEKPEFDLISILPSVILGPNRLITSPEGYNDGTNRFLYNLLIGRRTDSPLLGATVHVDDVALAHIRALDPKVEGNQDFLVTSGEQVVFDDAVEILRNSFPDAVKEGKLSVNGHAPTTKLNLDAEKTEQVLRIKFSAFEDQVKGLVEHYLELLG